MEKQSLLSCDTASGLPRLSREFNRGYAKAIRDITEEFQSVQRDLKWNHKNINYKFSIELLKLFLENRENFREDWEGFIRYNTGTKSLEFYQPEGRRK